MYDGFEIADVGTDRGTIHARIAGDGPPLLLLHGYPETHLMWHGVAPPLAEHFTVIAADLPGYGDSLRPAAAEDHAPHSKRASARDLVQAMAALGHERFAVAGHDRGGRVAYRMALDHPETVTALAVLDIVPTAEVWARADAGFALGYWHWGFLAQPPPLPEQIIGAGPDTYFDVHLPRLGLGNDPALYPPAVLGAYRRQFHDPATVKALCEDYRAGATIDRELDEADRGTPIACPVLALWADHGSLPAFYGDVLEVWRPWCTELRGHGVDARHFLVEDRPAEVAAELAEFFATAAEAA